MSRLQNSSPAQQLDFYQAMQDFTQMFPHMDCEVIEAVLRANNGAVDSTIDQLLTMNTEEEMPRGDISQGSVVAEGTMAAAALSPDYVNTQDFALLSQDLSGDEERDMLPELPPKQRKVSGSKTSAFHSPPSHQPLQQQELEVDSPDLMDASISEIMNLPPAPPPPDISPQVSALSLRGNVHKKASACAWETPAQPIPEFRHGAPSAPLAKNPAASLEKIPGVRSRSKSMPTTCYRPLDPVCLYRDSKWKPPLLGDLPDDFLRLDLSSGTPDTHQGRHTHRGEKHRRHRSQGEHGSPHHSDSFRSNHIQQIQQMDTFKTPQSPSTKTRSFKPTSHSSTTHRSHHSSRSSHHHHQPHGHHTFNPHSRPHHSPHRQQGDRVLNQSGDWLTARLVENERRRGQLDEGDAEMAQYLQDEYLALVLQNSEFLEELTRDAEFMQTLTRDSRKSSSSSPKTAVRSENSSAFTSQQYTQEPQLSSDMLPQSEMEGYGEDRQKELGAFPHDTDWGVVTADPPPSEEDKHLELRKQLESMGTSSKRKFADIARRFFSRKKKQPNKPLYKNLHTPSTMNLLLEEEVPEQHILQHSPT